MKIVCRCEDITEAEVMDAIERGCTTLEELKRELRCGMGICQGRNCLKIIEGILKANGYERSKYPTRRPLIVRTKIGLLSEK